MINDDEFALLVSEDVKNKLRNPKSKEILLRPENWSRWKDALIALNDNLDRQIDNIKEDAEADADRYEAMGRSGQKLAKEASRAYQQKIVKIERFKFYVNRRLDDVIMMIETGEEVKSDGWEQVAFLKRAIAEHRKLLTSFDLEATEIDRALWASLQNEWNFDSITEDNL